MARDYYENYSWNSDVTTGDDSGSNRGTTLNGFGQSVGSGHPRVRRIGNRWRVWLAGVRLADDPLREAEFLHEDLEKAMRGYIALIKGEEVVTPHGNDIADDDLTLN